MAVDISQQAYQVIQQVVQKILGSREEAAAYAEDPMGYLTAEGACEYDPTGVDMGRLMQQAVQGAGTSTQVSQYVQQGYGGGGGHSAPPTTPAPGQSPADYLVQHVNYVTYATYEGDDYITQQLTNVENYDFSTNIDNSVNLDGNFAGDVQFAVANATGDGAVAAGRDISDNQINTGEFTGVQADNTDNAIVGDNAQALQVAGSDFDPSGGQFAFGSGDVTNVDQSGAQNTAAAVGGGNATNVADNEVDTGGALAVDGDASGQLIDAGDFAVITTEQGEGDLTQQLDVFPGGAPYEGEEEDLSGQI
jgi:hypothetical protein